MAPPDNDDTIAVEVPQSPSIQPVNSQARRAVTGPSRKEFAKLRDDRWLSTSLSVKPEHKALRILKRAWNGDTSQMPKYEGYRSRKPMMFVDVDAFEVYRSPSKGDEERRCENLSINAVPKPTEFYMDGIISLPGNAKARAYVEKIHFYDITIEGFGDEDSPCVQIACQSIQAKEDKKYDIWYILKRPAAKYKIYHEPFLWVAQLTKHVIDYTEDQEKNTVGLESFRTQFYEWLTRRFPTNEDFRLWHAEFGYGTDFRNAVNAYIEFIAHHTADDRIRNFQPLWDECMVNSHIRIKKQPQKVKFTLATPNVFKCFKEMYFNEHLKEFQLAPQVRTQQEHLERTFSFPEINPASSSIPRYQKYGASPIEVGDVVAIEPSENEGRGWRTQNQDWIAYVQGVTRLDRKTQRLSIIWVYRPSDTNIFRAEYPIKNELFFSDHCNCKDAVEILSFDVKGKYDVAWSPMASTPTDRYFIRQTYIRESYSAETAATIPSAFESLRASHKTCKHRKGSSQRTTCRPGDTVYRERMVDGNKVLDPVIITEEVDPGSGLVGIQVLLRLSRDCAELAASINRINIERNELVLTDRTEYVPASEVKHDHKCSIGYVPKDSLLRDLVPFPYNRGGAGDFWFVSMCLKDDTEQLSFLSTRPKKLLESNEMQLAGPKLRGLSIFSGGGSLDRGLEDGGAVEFHTAVDFSPEAIHTQMANAKNPSTIQLFCGSVDDHLKLLLSGKESDLCPPIGEVDFIAAGSPCPGFSSLQPDRYSDESKRNASHVTTFCSYVDVYRPQYGILENVVSIGDEPVGQKGQSVLAQLIACLVSLGYQVNPFIMDAWNYGSAQQRSRAIIAITAPGLAPLRQPWHTHRTHQTPKKDSLGSLPTGERYGLRAAYVTPFPHVSAAEIARDLPRMVGSVQPCIPFPDHRLSRLSTWSQRALFSCIPPGQGYKEAHKAGLIPPELETTKTEIGKAYRRIQADGLIPTITTGINVQDSRNGASGHWFEDRPIGILEARRAQGYPDDEVIVGSLTQQIRIIGNGVDRWVSFALGLALRRAVDRNPNNGNLSTPSSSSSSLAKSTPSTPPNETSKNKKPSSNFVTPRRIRPKPKPKPKPAKTAKRRWEEKEYEHESGESQTTEVSEDEAPRFKKQKKKKHDSAQDDLGVESSAASSRRRNDLGDDDDENDVLTNRQTGRYGSCERETARSERDKGKGKGKGKGKARAI